MGDQTLKSLKFTASWVDVFVPPPKWILASTNILDDELMSFIKMPMDASLIAIWRAFHQCLWFCPDAWWPPSLQPLQIQVQRCSLPGFLRMFDHHHCNHQFLIPLVPELDATRNTKSISNKPSTHFWTTYWRKWVTGKQTEQTNIKVLPVVHLYL